MKRTQGQPLKNAATTDPDKLYATSITLSGKNRIFLERLFHQDGKSASARLRELLDLVEAETIKRQGAKRG